METLRIFKGERCLRSLSFLKGINQPVGGSGRRYFWRIIILNRCHQAQEEKYEECVHAGRLPLPASPEWPGWPGWPGSPLDAGIDGLQAGLSRIRRYFDVLGGMHRGFMPYGWLPGLLCICLDSQGRINTI